jgi:streptogramin lyase
MRPPTAALLTILTLLLTGCGMGPRLTPTVQPGAAMHGNIHGGQQPVSGAHVYLFSTGTSGFGAASTSLLTTGDGTDSLGTYVLSGADGSFTFPGGYTCTPNQPAYALAKGGDSGGGTNSAIGLMAVLGTCPGDGSFEALIPFIEINEVSTVAAAYALSGYATDSIHIASDELLVGNTTGNAARIGINNAAANAANFADLGTGTALATTPAGNGTVPQATINTLANIIAACVNSADVPDPFFPEHSSSCEQLLHANYSNGGQGYAPQTTADAAIYMAHNPSHNVSSLYALAAKAPPFYPALTSQPNDFTLTLAFTPTQLNADAMAFDLIGNLWYTYGPGLAELTPLGAEAPDSPFADSSLIYPFSLAIDTSNNIWVADYTPNTLAQFDNSGTLVQSNVITGYNSPNGLAFDPSGNLWAANLSGSVTETTASGSVIATYTGGGTLSDPFQVLSDGSGNIWLPNFDDDNVVLLNNDGTPNANSPLSASGISPSPSQNIVAAIDFFGNLWTMNAFSDTIGAISSSGVGLPNIPYIPGSAPDGSYPQADALAIDGHNTVWAAVTYGLGGGGGVHTGSPQPFLAHPHDLNGNFDTLYALDASGNPFLALDLPGPPNTLALDPSGNLWYSVPGTGFFEIVGLAAPVVTPIASAVANGKIATLP